MIAVLMSVYINDKATFIKEAIESLFSQSYKDFDLYLMIDGDINEEVQDLLENYNLYLFKHSVNKGIAVSLNELLPIILEKDYQYIARMDADDIALPNRFEKQIAYMEAHQDIDCLGTWAIEIDSKGNEYFKKRMPVTHDECFKLFRKRDCVIHPTVMFRRSYFEKAGLYPEDTYFGEDTMMWAKGFKNGCRFANLPEFLFNFRLDENFFQRRRGWKHAKSIFNLRRCVNKMLGFGLRENCYAFLYAIAKMMPTRILNVIYQKAR